MMTNLKALRVLMESDGDVYDEEFLKAQKHRELRIKKLKELKDPCPYCKFNLKSGKDQCDECGKEFYEIKKDQKADIIKTETMQNYLEPGLKQPWRPRVSGIIGFIFGPLAAGLLTFINFRRLGKERKATLTLLYTFVGSILLFLLLGVMKTEQTEIVGPLVGNIVCPLLFPFIQKKDFKIWRNQNPQLQPNTGWNSIGWGVIGSVIFFVLALIIAVVMSL